MYSVEESQKISRMIAEAVSGKAWYQLLTAPETALGGLAADKFNEMEIRLLHGEPVQYVLGKAWFLEREFEVDASVLIPRPETEELVLSVMHSFKENQNLRILDIGTGSGCIAISLALELKHARLTALDVSLSALTTARKNAMRLGAEVEFIQQNILSANPTDFSELDAIISNPPYIPQSESAEMHQNVIGFEPHDALFVPDDSPLLFYNKIAELGKTWLKKGGKIFFETSMNSAGEVMEIMKKLNYRNVTLKKDLFERERMVVGEWWDREEYV